MVTEFESYLDFRWYEGLLYLSTLILYIYIVIFVYWNIVCTELCMYKYVLRKINQLRKKKKKEWASVTPNEKCFDETMILSTRLEFYSASSLKQQFTDRNVALLGHNILIRS